MLNVKLQLFALVAKQPAFHQLRSVEQLGYIAVLLQRWKICSSLIIILCMEFSPFSFVIFMFLLNVGMTLVFGEYSLSSNPLQRYYSAAVFFIYTVKWLPNLKYYLYNRVLDVLI